MSSFPFDRYQAKENFSASLVHMEVLHSVTIGYAHQVELRENGYGFVPVPPLYANGECTISSLLEWPQQDIGKYSVTIGNLTAAETADRDK